MIPSKTNHSQGRLFQQRLSDLLDSKHELYRLANLIDWDSFDQSFSSLYKNGPGQPPKPIRLIIGLLMLQHIYDCSDEEVVSGWIENPYWQFFCGYDYFQWNFPIDPSSLTRWRNRLGKEGMEKILSATIHLAIETKTVKKQSLKKVIVDTTVMPKNIAHPIDIRLYAKGCEKIIKMAQKHGVTLRQSYSRLTKKAVRKRSQYAHARQMKRAKREERRVKTFLRRLERDVRRKIQGKAFEKDFNPLLEQVNRLLNQKRGDKNKLYSLHEPEVECISKGKAHKKYEFGKKVSIVITHKEGLCLSSQAFHGNPYDGHTLGKSLKDAEDHTKKEIKEVYVDKGYRGHEEKEREVFITGQRKGMTRWIKKQLKRRQSIEPNIGHMKQDGKLGRNYLKGKNGDEINALLVGTGHNLRMILRKLRIFFHQFWKSLFIVIEEATFVKTITI